VSGLIDGTATLHVHSNHERDCEKIELASGRIDTKHGGHEYWVDDLRVSYQPGTVTCGNLQISIYCGVNPE
jgi:hypothetical protein